MIGRGRSAENVHDEYGLDQHMENELDVDRNVTVDRSTKNTRRRLCQVAYRVRESEFES